MPDAKARLIEQVKKLREATEKARLKAVKSRETPTNREK